MARQQGRLPEAERILNESTKQYPEDAETWMQLAELYFHQNPLRARSPHEALGPLQHVLVLDPLNVEAISHLVDLAQMRGERPVASLLAERLLTLSDDPTMVMSYRLTQAWGRGDEVGHAAVLTDLRAPGLARSALKSALVRGEWQMDGFTDAEAIAGIFNRAATNSDRAFGAFATAAVQLLRGQPDAARASMARAVEMAPSGSTYYPYFVPWIDSLDFVESSPSQLQTARAAAEGIDPSTVPFLAQAKRYLVGVLALRAGDLRAAEESAGALDRMQPIEGSSITTDLGLALRARLLAARHDVAGALAMIEKQELRIPVRYAPFLSRISETWLRAELLKSTGRPREALPLYDSLTFYSVIDPILFAAAQLRKGQLLERLGETEAAIAHYARFAELWANCEPPERKQLSLALARLAQLRNPASARAAR
jgi:tetratricopeptide (TPR) repeat protein